MSRHNIYTAIILHQYPVGENHASLSLLSSEAGLISVLGHGIRGAKSSLRPRCQTYSLVKAWIYEDTQRRSSRLSDVEVISDYLGIRENLHALYHAAACAEILSRTPLQPEDAWAYSLYLIYLERLDVILRQESDRQAGVSARIGSATIQFLWRYLGFTGYQPDPGRCASTGLNLESHDAAWLSSSLGGFVSISADSHERVHGIILNPGALQYLRHSRTSEFGTACEIGISIESRSALLRLLFGLVQDAFGFQLKSLLGQEFLFYG